MLPEATTTILRRLNATSRIDFGIEEIGGVSARSELAALELAGVVTRSGRLNRVRCVLCDEGHFSEVEYLDNPLDPEESAYYDCPEGGRIWLSSAHLQKWSASIHNVCSAISKILDLNGRVRLADTGLYEIGQVEVAGARRPLYLFVRPVVKRARKPLPDREPPIPGNAIVLELARRPSEEWFPSFITVVSLYNVLSFDDGIFTIDRAIIEEGVAATRNYVILVDDDPNGFRHSPDFRSVWLRGREFNLTSTRASIVRVLYEAWKNKTPDVGLDHLLVISGSTPVQRLRDVFKGVKHWQELVEEGKTRGSVRLKL